MRRRAPSLDGSPFFHAVKAPLSSAKDWHTSAASARLRGSAKLTKPWPADSARTAAVYCERAQRTRTTGRGLMDMNRMDGLHGISGV
jgi:hypothetical protein